MSSPADSYTARNDVSSARSFGTLQYRRRRMIASYPDDMRYQGTYSCRYPGAVQNDEETLRALGRREVIYEVLDATPLGIASTIEPEVEGPAATIEGCLNCPLEYITMDPKDRVGTWDKPFSTDCSFIPLDSEVGVLWDGETHLRITNTEESTVVCVPSFPWLVRTVHHEEAFRFYMECIRPMLPPLPVGRKGCIRNVFFQRHVNYDNDLDLKGLPNQLVFDLIGCTLNTIRDRSPYPRSHPVLVWDENQSQTSSESSVGHSTIYAEPNTLYLLVAILGLWPNPPTVLRNGKEVNIYAPE